MTQVKIYDIENNEFHGGILTDDGSIICMCCGGLIKNDEVITLETFLENYDITGSSEENLNTALDDGYTHIIIEAYNNWIDLSEEMCGSEIVWVDKIEDYIE